MSPAERQAPAAAERLAAFAVADTPLPPAVRERMALHLIDVLGCGIAAVGLEAGDFATEVAASQGGVAEAALLGSEQLVPAPLAAMANGTRCHALDFDDTHEAGICHASTVVAPAALAVGQASGRDGAAVLDAYARGCEVAVRIAMVFADGAYERGFHPTSVCGAFGAAAAAARLRDLDPARTTRALGVVGSFAAGLLEYLSDGSATKPIHAGWAAQAGVQAAALAAAGAEGPASVIEGPFGLLASHGAPPERAAAVVEGIGEDWEAAAMSIKLYPACHFAHASAAAAAAIASEQGLGADEIAEIVVRIPAAGEQMVLDPLEAKQRPRTPYDAKFSLPFAVAHLIVRGELGLTAFSPEALADSEVLRLAARVGAEPLADADGQVSRFGGGARLRTRSGEEFDRLLSHAPGSPENPVDDAAVLAKFADNASLALPAASALELADRFGSIAAAADVAAPMAAAAAARPAGTPA